MRERRNAGNGIPPERIAQWFKKFSRLTGPEYAGKKGKGLGRYIGRETVENMAAKSKSLTHTRSMTCLTVC